MRLLVRNGLKMIFFNFTFHYTSFFMEQKQYTVDGNNKQTFTFYNKNPLITSQKEHIIKLFPLLKQNKKYFSEQIKLNTFSKIKTIHTIANIYNFN